MDEDDDSILQLPDELMASWQSWIVRQICSVFIVVTLITIYWILPLAIPYAILRVLEKYGWISFNWEDDSKEESGEKKEDKKPKVE